MLMAEARWDVNVTTAAVPYAKKPPANPFHIEARRQKMSLKEMRKAWES